MELNYAIDKARNAAYYDALFSDSFKEALMIVVNAAEKYGEIKHALKESV